MTTDEQLVVQVKLGHIGSYEELVHRYQRPLLSFVRRMVWDQHVAEEVVQDSLFAVYRHIDKVDVKKKFSTWVFEIAKNAAISRLRQMKPSRSLLETDLVSGEEDIYDYLAQGEKKDRVAKALARMPGKYAQVIKLYYFQDLAYEEIASKLKVPLNTVRTNLRRAKLMIRKFL